MDTDQLRQKAIKKLQKEEDQIYKEICKFIVNLPDTKKQKFFFWLNKYIENQTELEGMCNW